MNFDALQDNRKILFYFLEFLQKINVLISKKISEFSKFLWYFSEIFLYFSQKFPILSNILRFSLNLPILPIFSKKFHKILKVSHEFPNFLVLYFLWNCRIFLFFILCNFRTIFWILRLLLLEILEYSEAFWDGGFLEQSIFWNIQFFFGIFGNSKVFLETYLLCNFRIIW